MQKYTATVSSVPVLLLGKAKKYCLLTIKIKVNLGDHKKSKICMQNQEKYS